MGYGTVWVMVSLGSGSLGYGTVWVMVLSRLWYSLVYGTVWDMVQSGFSHSLGFASLCCGESGLRRFLYIKYIMR